MGDKRIKLYSPTVTQTSSIIEETHYSANTRNRFRKYRTRKTILLILKLIIGQQAD